MSRLPCLVPFCRCTRGIRKGEVDLPSEWICGKHWHAVPRQARASLVVAARLYRKRFGRTVYWEYPAGSDKRIAAVEIGRAWEHAWDECKRLAIEMAAGL